MSKRYLYIVVLSIILLAAWLITSALYPPYAAYFPGLAALLLLDIYFWYSIRKQVSRWHRILSFIVTYLYWVPLIILVSMTLASLFVPIESWNAGWRTYLMGVVFIVYSAKLFAVIFLLLADLVRVFRHLFRFLKQKKRRVPELPAGKAISRSKFMQNIGLLGGGVILSGLIIGMVRWAFDFKIRRVNVAIPHLPPVLDCFRIVQISDLHLGSWTSHQALEEAVIMINRLDPDLVVFTGDMVNFTSREAWPFRETLSKIKSWYGIYAILGNHDFGDYVDWDSKEHKEANLRELEVFYQSIGWTLLRNRNEIIEIEKDTLAIIGVDNWSAIDRFPRYGDLNQALKGTENASVRVLLSHDPTHWETVVMKKHPEIDLTLSGHTHGFQFGVESRNFRWSPAQYMYRYWAGFYGKRSKSGIQYLYVNRGLGNIGYPGRVGIYPEISLLTLQPEAQEY
ncbi:MAG: metallophosphoesterase [Bacteroidetes bacterium]|nr:metallophosphoesterase [Bacteroidota bacterium]